MPLAFNVPVPSEVVPLRKVMVPVGVWPDAAVVVAVSVTDWPKGMVVGAATRLVVVLAPMTATVMGGAETETASVVEPP